MFMMLLTNPGLMLKRFAAFFSRGNFLVMKKIVCICGEDASERWKRDKNKYGENIMMPVMKKCNIYVYMLSISNASKNMKMCFKQRERKEKHSIYNRTSAKKLS